jgi:hypothetical protein
VADQLGRHGRRVTGPVEERVRPWSLVWRVPTDAGDAWFKANSDGTRYEAGVLAALARLTAGGYGVCAGCGGPIGADRLAARPDAARCITCAAAR